MTINDIYNLTRELAKSTEMQTLYSHAKELKLSIFENTNDYTPLQLYFLQFLGFYASINLDVYMGEVDKMVLNNFIYEDAYAIAREKSRKKTDNTPTPYVNTSKTNEIQKIEKSRWVFRQPKGKRLI